ncbi:hypothetical protein GCM10025867_11180 [Frondihabitans sucicola]|uniref:Uncharacterized protein n=1 Tax=Frondihabitans sucicola TaxID=1268041 RepID=A0ABM8GKG1_9MICO|nr:hypothetical protein [Frondihabitans sucicola]BDZ48877.1 hypothetical protein GCM10025867_11180 [Frondihabitans sucicola]
MQAALCAAAASALFRTSADGRVRINVPIDLRSAVDLDDDVVIRFSATMVDLERVAGEPFWDLARRAHGQLDAARQPATVQATALMIAAATPATPEEAEGAMLAATGADIEITNLGVVDPSAEAEISALWGPTMTTQVDGERILGVVTSGGVLRLVNVTHDPSGDIAADIVGALAAALD